MSDHGRQIPDVSDRLADLAGTAGRAAALPPAQAIRRRGRRRVLRQRVCVAVLAVVVLIAGTVGARFVAPAYPPQPPAGTPTPDRTPSPDGSPDPTAIPTNSTPAQPSRSNSTPPVLTCRRPGIVVSAGRQDSASGHRSVVLVFTNAGSQPCRLTGYPGVAGLNTGGSQVAQAQRTPKGYLGGLASGGPPVVTLSPGQSASALVEALAFNASDGSACTAFAGILVTAPDDTVSTRVPWDNDGCGGLQVHPVVPGTSGRST